MRTTLRRLRVVACFVGGWLTLLFALSWCGLEVRHAGGELVRLVKGKLAASQQAPADPVAPVIQPRVVATEPPTAPTPKGKGNPLIPADLRVVVPPCFYAVPGTEMSLYFDNIVMTQHPDQLRFEVQCDVGHSERRRWTVTPTSKDVGEHPLAVTIKDWRGKKVLGRATTKLVVSPPDAGKGEALRLLIVGSSLTDLAGHLNELVHSLSLPDNPRWELLGTNTTRGTPPGVRHEGYGGWTWHCFVTWNEPGSAKRRHRDRSPFLYPTADGKLKLDVARYFREHCGGKPPDVVLFELGVNDVFCLHPEKRDVVEGHITFVLNHADQLIAAFRAAAPDTAIAILLTPQLNVYDRIYQDIYALEYNSWRVRQNTHRYLERASANFAGREKDRIYTIPAFVNFDAIEGYPVENAAHPNDLGCRQYAASIHAWIKHWYATRGGVSPQLLRVKHQSGKEG